MGSWKAIFLSLHFSMGQLPHLPYEGVHMRRYHPYTTFGKEFKELSSLLLYLNHRIVSSRLQY